MKTQFVSRRRFLVGSVAALCGFAGVAAFGQTAERKLRVGVYDSRAIAVAYCNSPEFQKSLKPIQADYEKAKQAKNEKRMKEIDAMMKARQRRQHEQGFSTGSVAGIMAGIKNALPSVAQKARVDVIVSKWELNYQSPGLEVVDVTDELVALFKPSEKALGWVKDLRTKQPLPIEEITDDMD